MRVFGLTGKNAAGKGEVANYLKTKSFSYFSLSDAIRDEAKIKGLDESRETLIKIGNKMREEGGPGILAIRTREKIKGDSIIDSIRNPKEVEELKKINGFKLIKVDAPIEIRFQRAMERGRVENANSLEEFKAMEEKENSDNPNAQQLNKTIELADMSINNDGTLEDLHLKIDKIMDI